MPDHIRALVHVAEAIRMLPNYITPFCKAAEILDNSRTNIYTLHDAMTLMASPELFDFTSRVRDFERVVDRFTEAAGGIDQIRKTADSMAETTEALTMVDTVPVAARLDRLEKRNIFWIGFAMAIGVMLALGILIAVLFK